MNPIRNYCSFPVTQIVDDILDTMEIERKLNMKYPLYHCSTKEQHWKVLVEMVNKAFKHFQENDIMKAFDSDLLELSSDGHVVYDSSFGRCKVTGEFTRQQLLDQQPDYAEEEIDKIYESYPEHGQLDVQIDNEEEQLMSTFQNANESAEPEEIQFWDTNLTPKLKSLYSQRFKLWKKCEEEWLNNDPISPENKAKNICEWLEDVNCMDRSCSCLSEVLTCLLFIHKNGYNNWESNIQLTNVGLRDWD